MERSSSLDERVPWSFLQARPEGELPDEDMSLEEGDRLIILTDIDGLKSLKSRYGDRMQSD